MIETSEFVEIKTNIAVIQRDVKQIEVGMSKLDQVVNALAEVVKQMAIQDKAFEGLERQIRTLEAEAEEAAVHKVQFERSIRDQIQENQKSYIKDRDVRHKELLDTLTSMNKELLSKLEEQDDRINALEKWRYYILGVSAVIIFLVGKFDFPQIF